MRMSRLEHDQHHDARDRHGSWDHFGEFYHERKVIFRVGCQLMLRSG